jgi:type II secretory pathway pseudopilin PulG
MKARLPSANRFYQGIQRSGTVGFTLIELLVVIDGHCCSSTPAD